MKFSQMIRFVFKLTMLQIQYFFSRKKKIPSDLTTPQSLEVLTLSDFGNPAHLAQPTSPKQSCSPPKELPKKRDSQGRYVRS